MLTVLHFIKVEANMWYVALVWYLKNPWYAVISLQILLSSAHKNVALINRESEDRSASFLIKYLFSSFLWKSVARKNLIKFYFVRSGENFLLSLSCYLVVGGSGGKPHLAVFPTKKKKCGVCYCNKAFKLCSCCLKGEVCVLLMWVFASKLVTFYQKNPTLD